jgi:hypothetical protein
MPAGKQAKSEDEVKTWDTEFCKVDQGTLFELILVRWLFLSAIFCRFPFNFVLLALPEPCAVLHFVVLSRHRIQQRLRLARKGPSTDSYALPVSCMLRVSWAGHGMRKQRLVGGNARKPQ